VYAHEKCEARPVHHSAIALQFPPGGRRTDPTTPCLGVEFEPGGLNAVTVPGTLRKRGVVAGSGGAMKVWSVLGRVVRIQRRADGRGISITRDRRELESFYSVWGHVRVNSKPVANVTTASDSTLGHRRAGLIPFTLTFITSLSC